MASHAVGIERTLPEVLQRIARNIQEIIRAEVRLAKAETAEELKKAKGPAGLIGAGVYIGLYAGAGFLLAAIYGLSTIMATWLAALIVGVVLAVFAAIFINTGAKHLKDVRAVPRRTAETMKENVEWAKTRIR